MFYTSHERDNNDSSYRTLDKFLRVKRKIYVTLYAAMLYVTRRLIRLLVSSRPVSCNHARVGLCRKVGQRRVASRLLECVHSSKAPPPPILSKGCVGRVRAPQFNQITLPNGTPGGGGGGGFSRMYAFILLQLWELACVMCLYAQTRVTVLCTCLWHVSIL